MHDHGPGRYGAAFADVYDEWYGTLSDTDRAAETLAKMADGPPPLELGVGTGRIALTLGERVAPVVGVDASREMLDRLRLKPGSERVTAVMADMARLPFGSGSHTLVYAAFNTFFNLDSLPAQQACLADVVRVLRPGGRFVLEAFVPPAGMPRRGVGVRDLSDESVTVTTTRHDASEQIIVGEHVDVTPDGVVRRGWSIRYALPTELDAMALSAGLLVENRCASWDGEPFTDNSDVHVTVYRKPLPDRRA